MSTYVPDIAESEKELVLKLRAAKKQNLIEGTTWNLIASTWMKRWAEYVNFDGGPRYMYLDAAHPGCMDNSPLVNSESGQLQRNLAEGLDYAVVPSDLYAKFKGIYGGGPDIERKVVLCHSLKKIYMIDLYPVVYNVYVHDSGTGIVDNIKSKADMFQLPEKPRVSIERSRFDSFAAVQAAMLSTIGLQPEPTRYNIWIRGSESSFKSKCLNAMPSADGLITVPRYMTTDVTNTLPGMWVPAPKDNDLNTRNHPNGVIDVLIELLHEEVSSTMEAIETDAVVVVADFAKESTEDLIKQAKEDTRARAGLLSYWLHDLQIGDVVDGKDAAGVWYEAVIVPLPYSSEGQAFQPGSVRLHFKGWASKWDDTVLPHVVQSRIWPLYSKTMNWRGSLRIYDKVELLVSAPDEVPRWVIAQVIFADLLKGIVKLQYDKHQAKDYVTLEIQSEKICKHPTHVKQVSALSTSSAMSVSYTSRSHLTSAYRGGLMSGGRSHETGPLQAGGAAGVVGLRNLGNTCFMNSMLQCLSHAKALTDVFLSDNYLRQINTDNVLGMGGKIAKVYGNLLKDMWAQKYSVVNPYEFKETIGEFQPQFAGYQQQDSQEFMLYLLDGLHEDMNRVLKKPFVEKIESKGRPDNLISREAWRRFLLRNDSEIVDRVFGQLKSHVTCRNCRHVSVTFDEFNSLALPVPVKNSRIITVTLFPLPVGSVPIVVPVAVELTSSIKDLKQALVTLLGPDILIEPQGSRKRGYSVGLIDTLDNTSDIESIASEYVLVGADDDSPTSNNDGECFSQPTSKLVKVLSSPPPESDGKPRPPNYNLHATIYSTYGKKITWTLTDKSPVQDIMKQTSQQLYVFQLEHDASPREYHEYDTNTNQNVFNHQTNSTRLSTDIKPKANEVGARFVDIVMMKAGSFGSYISTYNYTTSYPSSIGCGGRVSFEIGITRHKDLYGTIEKLAMGFLPPNSPFEGFSRRGGQKFESNESNGARKAPFRVMYTNIPGVNTANEFPYDSGDTINEIIPRNQLICLWSDDALAHVDATFYSENVANETATVEDYIFRRRKFSAGVVSSPYLAKPDAIPGSDSQEYSSEQMKSVPIKACLDKFIEREVMPDEETWFCPACKEHKSPIKKFDIWAAPEILIVQLKRFQYIPGSYFIHREKINDLVEFPVEGLDLTEYVRGEFREGIPPPVYDLFAVSEHSGGLGGGHYTAVARTPRTDEWINYNDSYCSRASTGDIVTPAAYILFYKRRGGNVKWAGIEPLPLGILDDDKSTS